MKHRFILLTCLAITTFTSACHQTMKARSPEILSLPKGQITYTTVVRELDELPRCDAGADGLKAYVSRSDGFVKCSNHRWQNTLPGDTTGRFEARSPIRYNEWHDAKGKKRWLAPGNREIEKDELNPRVCRKGWNLPTAEELGAASKNGLFDGIKAHGGIGFDKAWTVDKGAVAGIAKGVVEDSRPAQAGIYCVAPA